MSKRPPASPAARQRAVKRRIWNQPRRFRASCALGLETILEGEVRELPDVDEVETVPGATTFAAPFDTVYAALLRLRCADALRVWIGDEAAASFPMLRDHLARLDWSLWLPDRCALDVRVRSRTSRLRDDAGIERTLRQAVRDHGIDERAGEGAASVQVRIELAHDRATVWLDAGGAPLHHRAGERWVAPTTLRETTAAALCVIGVPRDADLVLDPFCGSGTLIEEAASWLDDRCPGARRGFALAATPAWSEARMRHARRTVCPPGPSAVTKLIASDVDDVALRAATTNVARAGLQARVELSRRDVRAVDPAAMAASHGARRPVLLANPPYGRRADAVGAEPNELVGGVLARAAGWSFALAYPDPDVVAAVPGVHVDRVVPIRMRGFSNALVVGRVGIQGAGGDRDGTDRDGTDRDRDDRARGGALAPTTTVDGG